MNLLYLRQELSKPRYMQIKAREGTEHLFMEPLDLRENRRHFLRRERFLHQLELEIGMSRVRNHAHFVMM